MKLRWTIAFILPLSLLLVGPAPGSVGACSSDGNTIRGTADPEAFCVDLATVCCARRRARGEIDRDTEEPMCVEQMTAGCASFNFACNPGPSQQRVDSCISRLRERDMLSTQIRNCIPSDPVLPFINDIFPECELCGGALTATDPAQPEIPWSFDPSQELLLPSEEGLLPELLPEAFPEPQ